jgi:hypothetical protein
MEQSFLSDESKMESESKNINIISEEKHNGSNITDIDHNEENFKEININKNNSKEKDNQKENPKDKHWTKNNTMTLLSWIAISTYNIDCLEIAIIRYRNWIRQHVILGLILSTTSGTLSVTQFGNINSQKVNFILNFFFTIFSFMVAISTGCIKVYQVQERLEKFITVKQEWIAFVTKIATELQLHVSLRKDALELININKSKYLDLLKIDNEIPEFIKKNVQTKFSNKKRTIYSKDFHSSLEIGEAISISDIIMNIGYVEGKVLCLLEKEKNNKELDFFDNEDLLIENSYDKNYRNCISRSNSFDHLKDIQHSYYNINIPNLIPKVFLNDKEIDKEKEKAIQYEYKKNNYDISNNLLNI